MDRCATNGLSEKLVVISIVEVNGSEDDFVMCLEQNTLSPWVTVQISHPTDIALLPNHVYLHVEGVDVTMHGFLVHGAQKTPYYFVKKISKNRLKPH